MSVLPQFALKQTQANSNVTNNVINKVDMESDILTIEAAIKAKRNELDTLRASPEHQKARADESAVQIDKDHIEYKQNEQDLIRFTDELNKQKMENDKLKSEFSEIEEGKSDNESLEKIRSAKGNQYVADYFKAQVNYNSNKSVIAIWEREVDSCRKKKEEWDALISKAAPGKPLLDMERRLLREWRELIKLISAKAAAMATAAASTTASAAASSTAAPK